jgi:hypothetical protein
MHFLKGNALCIFLFLFHTAFSQIEKKKINAVRITTSLKIDGILDEPEWKIAPVADKFIALRPTPFKPESPDNKSEVYFLYNDEGLYVGGYFHEKTKDSIASELIGRDNFGNNDFAGIILDTYNDKLNGFEYFVTPLGEQMDAKQSYTLTGNSEDFTWNAVWKSAAKIHDDGWSFEMFIPFSAIRFSKKKGQEWGLNIVRRRQKSGEQLFWQSIDPTVNGFLTQEGMLLGITDINPPLRLQFSPYFATYDEKPSGENIYSLRGSGGMDVKYGINQAYTLDMTLIPDFGQVVTDNRILNLSPFEVKYQENRPFFTEGTDLFNKGNLFYSRRIGIEPNYRKYPSGGVNDSIISDPAQAKIVNATKISGRSESGLGIGLLNAITTPQYTTFLDTVKGTTHKEESMPFTNYTVFVADQTLKHNSSISFVNTNVWRSSNNYKANVSAAVFDLNDKKNKWNLGGNISISQLYGGDTTNNTGYAHSLYFGKSSGKFNFYVDQDLLNAKYDKNDLGYFTNNNTMNNYLYLGYSWIKPKRYFSNLRLNFNFNYTRLVSPIDLLKRNQMMYQSTFGNINMNGQTKKRLWFLFAAVNWGFANNDFYEPRDYGRVFQNKGKIGIDFQWNSNQTKKLSWGGEFNTGIGGIFNRTNTTPMLQGKIRFSSKFSIDNSLSLDFQQNNAGWAATMPNINGEVINDTIIFSRRTIRTVENILNFKYNFTNKIGATLRLRHYWSKVDPQQYYQLNSLGALVAPGTPFTQNVNQNYNFFSGDFVFTWQFDEGSFINIAWKGIGESSDSTFQKNYFTNLNKTITGPQSQSFSLSVIYFLDVITAKKKLKKNGHKEI